MLSFKVPTAVPTRDTQQPYVVLSSGAAACVFEIIPGLYLDLIYLHV